MQPLADLLPELIFFVKNYNLPSTVSRGERALYVEDNMCRIQMRVEIEVFEFFVSDGGDAGVEFGVCGKFVDNVKTVFAFGDGGICPGIEDGDVEVVFLKGAHDVDNLGVAYVGAVLLECEAHHKRYGCRVPVCLS